MAFSPESAIKTNGARDGEPIRVMVVDDSVIIRGLLTRILETENDISVVASVGNGKLALEKLERIREIDVVLLDIEMPVMDGLTALPLLLRASRTVKVIMASTLTKKNAEVSIKAMQLGAAVICRSRHRTPTWAGLRISRGNRRQGYVLGTSAAASSRWSESRSETRRRNRRRQKAPV